MNYFLKWPFFLNKLAVYKAKEYKFVF